jgi:hypothetical protein
MMFRQGDILVVTIDEIPDAAKTLGQDLVLATGEATGHAHRVEGLATQFITATQERFLTVTGLSVLRHEEHGPIELPPGNYRVIRQREYEPLADRTVRD